MPQTFPGITNQNSFFSDHHLSDLFAKVRRKWEQDAEVELSGQAARRQLTGLYLQAKQAYDAGMERGVLSRSAGKFQVALLEALGYERQLERHPVTLENRHAGVSLLTRIARSEGQDALWIVEYRSPIGNPP